MEKNELDKLNLLDLFFESCRQGVKIIMNTVLPSVIFGYTLVHFLTMTGLVDLAGKVLAPVMAIFGLPGEAVVVLVAAFFDKLAGATAAAALYEAGTLTALQTGILMAPCMLFGTLLGHYARIVLVAGVRKEDHKWMFIGCIIVSIIGLFMLRAIA